MITDPLALLRKLYTAEQARKAYEAFDPEAEVGLCWYLAEARNDEGVQRGDQYRKASYFDVPDLLQAMGGEELRHPQQGYFWPIVEKEPLMHWPMVSKVGQQERLLFLAFMITWLEDVG